MPASQILLADYRGNISLEDKDVSHMFMKRMHKKYKISDETIKKLITRDKEIFDKRGDDDSSYAFYLESHLSNTLNILYNNILPEHTEEWFYVDRRFSNLTFSELATARRLFGSLQSIHLLNEVNFKKKGDIFKSFDEDSLVEYYGYLNKSVRAYLQKIADCHSSLSYILNPSFLDNYKINKITISESKKQFSKEYPLFQELLNIKNNEEAYKSEMCSIEKHYNMERIYKRR